MRRHVSRKGCNRPEYSSRTSPPGYVLQQRRLPSAVARRTLTTGQAEHLMHSPLICAKHGGNVLQRVAISSQKARSLSLRIVKVGSMNLDTVQGYPSLGVSKCSHRFTSFMAAKRPSLSRRGGFTLGEAHGHESLPHHAFYGTVCCGRKLRVPRNGAKASGCPVDKFSSSGLTRTFGYGVPI